MLSNSVLNSASVTSHFMNLMANSLISLIDVNVVIVFTSQSFNPFSLLCLSAAFSTLSQKADLEAFSK
jgi:hypothetical protein